jgi:hypothetical protein
MVERLLSVYRLLDRRQYRWNDPCLAHTLDITPLGARLGALRTQLPPGMIISLQRGAKKAEFRVEWIKQLALNELQAGIKALEPRTSTCLTTLTQRRIRKPSCRSCLVTQNL